MNELIPVNRMKKYIVAVIGAGLILSIANMANAHSDNEKIISKTLSLPQITSLHLNASVGSVKISPSDDQQVHIHLIVNERDGFFSDSPKDAQLSSNKDKQHLKLALTGGDFDENWHIKVPANVQIETDLGVGSIEIKDIAASMSVDVGVGEAIIYGQASHFNLAEGEAGVGGASVQSSVGSSSSNRAMVSEQVNWSGSGQYRITVDVGVGDISIHLQ